MCRPRARALPCWTRSIESAHFEGVILCYEICVFERMGAHAWSERKHTQHPSSRSDLIARRMFRALPPADYGESDTETDQNLLKLGAATVAPHDDPKDGPDAEESGIPALCVPKTSSV